MRRSTLSLGAAWWLATAAYAAPRLRFTTPPADATGDITGELIGFQPGDYLVALYALSPDGAWWALRSQASLEAGTATGVPAGAGQTAAALADSKVVPFTLADWDDTGTVDRVRVAVFPASFATLPPIVTPGMVQPAVLQRVLVQAEAGRGRTGDSADEFSGWGGGAIAAAAAEAGGSARASGTGEALLDLGRRLADALMPRAALDTLSGRQAAAGAGAGAGAGEEGGAAHRSLQSWSDWWFPADDAGGGASPGTLTVSAPVAGLVGPIVGRVTGPAITSAWSHRALVYVISSSRTFWGPKAAGTVRADGTFSVSRWATDPSDAWSSPAVAVAIVPASFSPPMTLGRSGLPYAVQQVAVAAVSVARGSVASTPVFGGGGPPAAPSPPALSPSAWAPPAPSPWAPAPPPPPPSGGGGGGGGGVTLVVNVPPPGSTGVIRGVVGGTPQAPSAYAIVAFTQDVYGAFWGPKGRVTPRTDGYFELSGWAQALGDASAPNLGVYLMPAGMVVPIVVGTQMPPNIMSAAVAALVQSRTAPQPPLPQPVPWTPPPLPSNLPPPAASRPPTGGGGGGGGPSSWPPGPPSGKYGRSNGRIAFAGRNWVVKDSGGAAVGPGPNVFVGSPDFTWVDSWGLHLNVRPRSGCSNWASSEVETEESLGYGTYLWSYYGPGETLDVQVVGGMFLWDDNGGQGIGWREQDFEICRWGDPGNPTAAQFCIQPLRPGNLPDWIRRFWMSRMAVYGGERGPTGGGGCNDPGDDNFNGASLNRMTCAMVWGPGRLEWWCWDGLFTLETLQQGAAQGKLVASYTYPHSQYVPPPGTEKWHFNLWQANTGAPAHGRRVHMVFPTFQFTKTLVDFRGMGFQLNVGIGVRLLGAAPGITAAPPAGSYVGEVGAAESEAITEAGGPGAVLAADAAAAAASASQRQRRLQLGDGYVAPSSESLSRAALLGLGLGGSGPLAQRFIRAPARDLSQEAQAIFNAQVGVPALVEVMALVAVAVTVAALAAMLGSQRVPSKADLLAANAPLLRRLLGALQRGVSGPAGVAPPGYSLLSSFPSAAASAGLSLLGTGAFWAPTSTSSSSSSSAAAAASGTGLSSGPGGATAGGASSSSAAADEPSSAAGRARRRRSSVGSTGTA